jgi:phosphomannomutase/phosphoglucomutase
VAQARFENARLTTIDGLRVDFDEGWGLVRQSNTVPGLTLRFEAETEVDLLNVRALISEQMLKIDPWLDLNW